MKYFLAIKRYIRMKLNLKCYDYQFRAFYNFEYKLNKKFKLKMTSGKIMNIKIIELDYYIDPRDMIESCWIQYLGYEGEKQFKEMSFIEFFKMATKE